MLDKLTIGDFRACLEESFQIDLGNGASLPLQLVRVRSLGEADQTDQREPFAVEFRGAGDPILAQQIYALSGPSLGFLEIFLVPIGPDDAGMLYEAVFT